MTMKAKTTRRSFMGLLAAVVPAVGALAAAKTVEAAPSCEFCEVLFRNPAPIPDAFKMAVTPEMTEEIIAKVHAQAQPNITSHCQVAAMLWALAAAKPAEVAVAPDVDLRAATAYYADPSLHTIPQHARNVAEAHGLDVDEQVRIALNRYYKSPRGQEELARQAQEYRDGLAVIGGPTASMQQKRLHRIVAG